MNSDEQTVERTDVSLEGMRQANQIVAGVLTLMEEEVRPGRDTLTLDEMAEDYIRAQGATPAFKGYRGFPNSITSSINEQIVHGIPSRDQVIEDGDIVSLDVGACKNGCYGDSAVSIGVGSVSARARQLLDVTRQSLYRGIQKAQVGNRLGEIGHAIEEFVKPYDFGVVRDWAGHFIGHQMHLEPQIPNYGPPDRGPVLEEGMFLAIEPMVNLGGAGTRLLDDGWTVVTQDGTLSAHFEHTIAVTEDGPIILSRRENEVLM